MDYTKIQKILKTLPKSPGIYKFLDEDQKVIYVGKANDLSQRVKQYFKKGYEHSTRTRKLVEKISNIETIGVDSELEAVILEHNIIKELQPKYNVIMKDDKSYVYIKITKEDFPRIQIVRKPEKDGAKYIGPKTAAHKVKETLKLLKKIFPFRHCNLDIELLKENPIRMDGKIRHDVKVTHKVIKYPCIDYHIKRCIAPCIGACSIEEYRKIVDNIENFLEGKADPVLKDLHKQMKDLALEKKFEKAAKLRDKIKKVEEMLEFQKVQTDGQGDQDIINYCITQDKAYFNLFQVRNGKLIDQQNFIFSATDIDEPENHEVLEGFLKYYYELATDIPKEIILPHQIENQKVIEGFTNAKFTIPQKGTKNKLLEMSLNNARIYADRNKTKWQEASESTVKATEILQKILKIESPLKRIECYDISHLSGTDTVGSMVVFEKGAPKNSHYRKFQIRSIQGKPDDYKSMEEVLTRRFSKIYQELKQRNFKVKKAAKDSESYLLKDGKENAGSITLIEHNPKVAQLKDLVIDPKYRGSKLGYKLIREVALKSKAKRLYGFIKPELKEYYLFAGFEEIKTIPEELKNQHTNNLIPMALDKIKLKKDESFCKIPDLVVIDGGKGQLSVATKVFQNLKLEIPYCSLAKRLEEIFTPDSKTPILLDRHNEALKLLQRARDEAHRFAISYNRNLRSKKFKKK